MACQLQQFRSHGCQQLIGMVDLWLHAVGCTTAIDKLSAYPQSQQRKMRDLEHEMEAMRAEAVKKEQLTTEQKARNKDAAKQIAELQLELENNAGMTLELNVVGHCHIHTTVTNQPCNIHYWPVAV